MHKIMLLLGNYVNKLQNTKLFSEEGCLAIDLIFGPSMGSKIDLSARLDVLNLIFVVFCLIAKRQHLGTKGVL